jgi:hypothetical protein
VIGSITKSNPHNVQKTALIYVEKKLYFRLHLRSDLCIITSRPAPRWAKWSRGVRTRGLRVGLVGGPRPLLFLGVIFLWSNGRHQTETSSPLFLSAVGVSQEVEYYTARNELESIRLKINETAIRLLGVCARHSRLFGRRHAVAFSRRAPATGLLLR